MRQSLLLCALLGYVIAVPAGNFHQEYTYKASSSSFKNNELQHRTDDQGYYKKDGDLEGRTKPRVDANSEHSEYVNPNLRGNLYSGYGESTDMNSYGLMNAQSGVSGYGTNQLAEGIASSDRIVGSRGYTAGSSNYGSSNYGLSNYDSNYGSSGYGSSGYQSASYGSSSNIQSIIQRLQQDFEREIQNQRWRGTYTQAGYDQSDLETQLRRNLTDRLNSELLDRYGQQTIRNGMSYSIADGRVESAANYNNQELVNLRQQLENNLLSRLRTQYNQGYGRSGSSSQYESHSESQTRYGYTSSTIRPTYQTLYPSLPVYSTTQRSTYTNNYAHSNYEVINSNTRYTPVVNPESISTIASSVQSQLDNTLNKVLDDIYRQHFSSSASYQLTNYDVVLNRIQNELRNNITYLLDDHVRRNYGSQTQRDGYFYSIGPNGQVSDNYNYALRDLEQLKAQVERNLIEKLNRQFETYRSRYTSQSHSYSSQSNYGSYDRYATTPRYVYSSTPYVYSSTHQYTTPRSQYYSKGGNEQYVGGSRQSGYGMSGGYSGGSSYSSGTYSSANMGQLQRQLQDELSRQLQTAISRDSSIYSSSGTYSPQNYQTSLQHLTDELNRNVTRHLQEFSGSASYSASGNYDQAQIESLRSELLSSLTRQLQQNLQQHFQSSSAYSSSSSSNYRPVRGFSNHLQGQYRSGGSVVVGEDCDHDSVSGLRMKRSPYQPYRSQPLSYYHSSDYSHGSTHNYHHHAHGYSGYRSSSGVPQTPNNDRNDQELEETGQQEMDLGQQVEDIEYIPPQSHQPKPQKVQEGNNGQQIEEDEFEPLQTGQQQQYDFGQQTVDVGQEAVDEEFGNVHLGSHHEVGQETDDSELTQQLEIGQPPFWNSQEPHVQAEYNLHPSQQFKPVSGNIHQDIGQEVDESDLTQQIEEFDNLQVGQKPQTFPSQNQYGEQEPHVHAEYNTLQTSQQYEPVTGDIHHEVGQQVDDSDLTQQVEEFDNLQVEQKPHALPSQNVYYQQEPHVQEQYNSPQTSRQYKPVTGNINQNQQHEIGQEVDNSDLTQQVEEVGQQSEQNLLGQMSDDSEGPLSLVHGFQSSSIDGKPLVGDWQSSKDQIVTSGNGKIVQNTIGQEFEHPELTQQVEEFEPIPKVLPTTITSDNQNQQTDYRGVNQQFEQSTFDIPKNPQVFDQQKARWISHKWKPNQDRFIESTKQRLLMKQEARLRDKQVPYFSRDDILNEISANVRTELKSYNSHFLTSYLGLTLDEIEGIEIIISGYLCEKFDEFQKFNEQVGTNRNVDQHFYRTNQYSSQQEIISSDNLQLGQIPEDDEQRPEEIDGLHAQVEKVSEGDVINSGLQSNVFSSPDSHDWFLKTWTEKQREFVARLYRKQLLRFNISSELGQFKDDGETEINKKLSQEIGNEISRYSDYFLFKFLGFKENDIKYIKENISSKLRDRWAADIRTNNNDIQLTTQHSYHNYQNNRAHQNVQQLTHHKLTPERDLLLDNQQLLKVDTLEQTSINQNDNSQTVENQFVEPLNSRQPNGHNTIQKPLDGKQYPQRPYFMQHTGANSLQQPQRRPSLPDSRAFIDREVGYAHQKDLIYSPTLNKVLEEENLKPPPAPLPNQSQQPVQQETFNQQPDGIGRVPLQKSSGQWYGLSSQGQVMTNQQTLENADRNHDQLVQKLGEKQTRPLVQVVEQPIHSIGSGYSTPDVNNNNYGVVDQTSSRRTGYSSVISQESSYGFQANGNNRYDGKLNYGRQDEEQQNIETTGNIQPLHYDKANEVHQREPLSPGNSLLGVKGHRKSPQRTIESSSVETPGIDVSPTYSSTAQPELVSEIQETTIASINDENLPWWKRFGNKIKQGASDLKQKIVG